MEFVAMLLFELHPHLLNSLRDYVARPSSQRGTVIKALIFKDRRTKETKWNETINILKNHCIQTIAYNGFFEHVYQKCTECALQQ